MKDNILIVHGGGPTAVINASLYGAIMEAKSHDNINHIYAAKNGTGGLLREELIELEKISQERLELLLHTPGSAIGTSRDHINSESYDKIADFVERKNIKYVLMNGGNGTMDTCAKLCERCKSRGYEIKIIGIPKTIDNDIAVTDHSPGYGSAAKYIAHSVKEVCADVKSMPIHVVVIEASGRNAGWLTAASALAGVDSDLSPDLIYLPERPFDEEKYISDIKTLLKKKTGIVVVASEGLKNVQGVPIVKPVLEVGRSVYFGDVSAHLANLVIEKLGYKARSEKPGLLGRASIMLQSNVDKLEAEQAGRIACEAVLRGESGKMVAFKRTDDKQYKIEPFLVDINKVISEEKIMPDHFINSDGNGVTREFIDWCEPLIGGLPHPMISFN